MPPKAPANFTKELESKHFTTGRVDHDFVNKKYEKTFLEVQPDLDQSSRTLICCSCRHIVYMWAGTHQLYMKSTTALMMKIKRPPYSMDAAEFQMAAHS
jgi:hypothetical protein